MRLEKKAQVGKFLTGFLAFLLIIALIAIFIALSSVLAKTKGAGKTDLADSVYLGTSNDLLFKQIEVEISERINGKLEFRKEKLIVADALVYYELGKIDQLALQNALKGLVDEQNRCLGIIEDSMEENIRVETGIANLANPGFKIAYYSADNKIEFEESLMRAFEKYARAGFLSKAHIRFLSNGAIKDLYVESYYCPCLEGDKNE